MLNVLIHKYFLVILNVNKMVTEHDWLLTRSRGESKKQNGRFQYKQNSSLFDHVVHDSFAVVRGKFTHF